MLHSAHLAICMVTVQLLTATVSTQQDTNLETITGTIYGNNNFTFYVNGEFIAQDPVTIIPHNAYNVSFQVEPGKDITFAIEGIDWANDTTGLEYGNRCVGDGGLRAMFSNGVVTNNQWVCSTYHYGPVNWKDCIVGQTVRDNSLQLLPACKQESTPQLEGCYVRATEPPSGWTKPKFDDSRWEYAIEYDDDFVGWGLRPTGCSDSDTYISPDVDPNGDNLTCPENLDWGESVFIWRPDLVLDNRILCRYTLKLENSAVSTMLGVATIMCASVINIILIAF